VRTRSIGVRLTLWYGAALAFSLLLFGAAMWFGMQHSMYHAVDESLRDRVEGVRHFIEQESQWLTMEEMRAEFREHSVLGPGGDLFQVADSEGNWIYRSNPLYDERVPVYGLPELESQLRFENVVIQGAPLRFLSQTAEAGGRTFIIQVAAPLHELQEGLDDFLWIVVTAVPLVLFAASFGGYWMSRRALHPVDEITRTARSITVEKLSSRLTVPQSGDELQRLSETLNDMIGRLEAAFQRIARFTADASHELRTPLSLMRTTAELSLRKPDDARGMSEALQQILAEVERTSQLVENLLWVARTDSGDERLMRERIDLVESAQEACIQASPLANEKQIRLESRLPSQPVLVKGDRQALRRLFLILIDNAVKYTPRGGHVQVVIEHRDGIAMGQVKDNGIGIPETEIPHIFERFYRVDKSRSREQGGAGLGLAIGRWIVEAHDGKIFAESQAGGGSTFRVELPSD
jgi:two-component system, OmpR family, heavy metal sensor histidine kinase CusS